jgi:hypothetical protein
MYSKLYYKDRIHHAVKERLGVLGEDAQKRIQVIREVTKELYAGEDDEIKAIVAAKVTAAAEASEGNDDEPNEPNEEGTARTPQDYQE